jgi:inositol 3-alpha-galactosyltransferase
LGRDGETHRWWWSEWQEWETVREEGNEEELLDLVRRGEHIDGYENIDGNNLTAIGASVQDLAKNWKKANGEAKN